MSSSASPAQSDQPTREKAPTNQEVIARGVLESLTDEKLVLSIPGTDYRLHLVPGVPASEFRTPVGKRVRGVIRASALRIHSAEGGGRFIEPVFGMPRIVAGQVIAADESKRETAIDVTVPLVATTMEGQVYRGILEPGRLVNCYIESGAAFFPLDD